VEQDEPEQEPPPDLPPPQPAPLPRDELLHKIFLKAIRTLKELMTKPSSKFIQAAEPEELEVVANFLNQIATAAGRAGRTVAVRVSPSRMINNERPQEQPTIGADPMKRIEHQRGAGVVRHTTGSATRRRGL
jgi:hypothetical protein